VAAAVDSSRKVLIVDPDASTRREIRAACEQEGYQVLEADGGAEAMRQFEHSRPNLILLEVTLPDGAGLDVCRELRKMDPAVPVIMMSSRSDEIDVVVALESEPTTTSASRCAYVSWWRV
jgi:Response regulators consisting of a CheY-like receiver domain and a winged-helix DNA-binding domain